MDLRSYYRQIAELEATIETKDALVASLETPDGGKAGVLTEVPRRVACQLVVEKKARLATPEEESEFRRAQQERLEAAERAQALGRLQIGMLPEQELKNLKNLLKLGRKEGA
jgi:hypothetical protein